MPAASLAFVALFAATSSDHADNVTAIAVAVVGVLVSAFVAWVTATVTMAGDERRAIREGTMRLMEWVLQYPFLETASYCDSWPNTDRDDDDDMRYGVFCCHVFNLLRQAYEFCDGDVAKMAEVLYFDELIGLHHKWWRHDPVNRNAYTQEFRDFVDRRIQVLAKERERGPTGNPH